MILYHSFILFYIILFYIILYSFHVSTCKVHGRLGDRKYMLHLVIVFPLPSPPLTRFIVIYRATSWQIRLHHNTSECGMRHYDYKDIKQNTLEKTHIYIYIYKFQSRLLRRPYVCCSNMVGPCSSSGGSVASDESTSVDGVDGALSLERAHLECLVAAMDEK